MVDTMSNRKANNEDEHSSSEQRQPSISDDTNGSNPVATAEAKGVGRKRTIDESLLDPEERRKLESRRAYNRQCAAKARKRGKELVEHLQAQVEELTKDKAELKRSNELMRAQLELLEQQNHNIMLNQLANQAAVGMGHQHHHHNPFGGVGGVMNAGAAAASFMGQGVGANNNAAASMSLLDRLTMERAAAQNRFQALQQQQSLGSMQQGNNNGELQSSSNNGRGYV